MDYVEITNLVDGSPKIDTRSVVLNIEACRGSLRRYRDLYTRYSYPSLLFV